MKAIPSIRTLFLLALLLIVSCGKNQPQKTHQNDAPQEQPATEQPAQTTAKNPYTRAELTSYLAQADARFKKAPNNDDLETVAARQYAITQELLVVTRALDTDGSYSNQIENYQERFVPTDNTASLSRRLMDSMLGMYSTTALLYTMRFKDTPEKLDILEDIGKDVERMMARNDPIIQPIARMSNGIYRLMTDILQDIDRDNTLASMFAHSDSLYRTGEAAAQSGEDRYLNSLYRTFEVGQIWVLQLRPKEAAKTSELKKAFAQNLMASENVGKQMAVATEYVYRVFRLVAILTLDVIYPQEQE